MGRFVIKVCVNDECKRYYVPDKVNRKCRLCPVCGKRMKRVKR